MEIRIDGEMVKIPDDSDLTLGETEMVAKHLKIDVGQDSPTLILMGLVFVAIRRKYPDGVIPDQIETVRALKIADLGLEQPPPVPLDEGVAAANGTSETTLPVYGPQG